MKRALLVASAAACLVVSTLLGSSHAQLQNNQLQGQLQTTQLQSNRMFGVYAGEVVSTQDPNQGGRILLKIPAVSPTTQLWARPSVPYVDGTIGSIKLPPSGSLVWVQFEAGDPARPVWTGWTPR